MAKWQIALALLVAAALRMRRRPPADRHYREVFGELAGRWPGGRIGVGRRGRGSGAVGDAIVVADPSGTVVGGADGQGRGLFAKFRPRDEFVGLSLPEFAARASACEDPGLAQALAQAAFEIGRKTGLARRG